MPGTTTYYSLRKPLGGETIGAVASDSLADDVDAALHAHATAATIDHPNASVTNVKLAPDVARRNLLTNGGFELWQRGGGAFTSSGAFSADRWSVSSGGATTASVGIQTNPTYTDGSATALGVVVGSYDGSNPAGVWQRLVGAEWGNQLAGLPVTFSVRVKASVANQVRIEHHDALGASYNSAYHSGGGAYETLSLTVPSLNGGSGYWDFHIRGYANGTYWVDNAMLAIGLAVVAYQPLHPAEDLARCQRYYELLDVPAGGALAVAGVATAGGQLAMASWPYRQVKPTVPTVTVVGTWAVTNCGQPTVAAGGLNAVRLTIASTAAGPFSALNTPATTTLAIEANL